MSHQGRLLSPVICFAVIWTGGHADEVQEPPKTVGYHHYLADACEKLDCYYTVERGIYRKDRPSPLAFPKMTVEEVDTVDELAKKLRRELKGVRVEVVSKDSKPPVIHLIERSLAESKDHPLDRPVSIEFRGSLSGLLERLARKPGGVSEQQMGGFPVPPPSDSETTTDVEVKNAKVRDVLTRAVLREGYRRLLWEASTFEQGGKPLVKIRFTGPKVPVVPESETEEV